MRRLRKPTTRAADDGARRGPPPLISVTGTEVFPAQVFGQERLFPLWPVNESFTAQTRGGWIPVTGTGMREERSCHAEGEVVPCLHAKSGTENYRTDRISNVIFQPN